MLFLAILRISAILILTGGLSLESHGQDRASRTNTPHQFDITSQPSPGDWQRFHKLSDAERRQLWHYHARLGRDLNHWSWEWRLGWLRRCHSSTEPYCVAILTSGLSDPALLVRAEAATILGQRHAGSEDRAVIDLLAEAYRNPANRRHNDPLIVPARILYAIHLIGGPHARLVGAALAEDHPENATYWRKIARLERN